MQIDFVIGLSLLVVVVTTLGMGWAGMYAYKHIKEDSEKAAS